MQGTKSIDYFFNPKSIAVLGASNTKGSIGYTIFGNLKNARKKVFPVNPKHATILGAKSFKSIKEINRKIELAVIAVPAVAVPKVLEECMQCKVKAVIIISAGFSETGEKKLTNKIAWLISKYPGTRVMGPNCVGVYDYYSGIDTTFFERSRMKKAKRGNISLISQSGALGSLMLDWIATQRFGVSKFASYGNAMDVDEADLLEYLGKDKRTKVIAIYMEGAKEGRKFFETAKNVATKKPIIILKGGKHEETLVATASHTGSLAGSSKVYDAVFRQAGIISADDMLDMFGIAKLLEAEPLPRGKRVQIITNGGGFGIITADQVVANGLRLAKLSSSTKKQLKKEMPMASIGNPLDLLGDADVKRYLKAIKACHSDRNVDAIMVLILFNLPSLEARKIAELRKPKEKITKPIMVVSVGSNFTQKYLERLGKRGFTTFNYPSIAAKSLRGVIEYSEFLGLLK